MLSFLRFSVHVREGTGSNLSLSYGHCEARVALVGAVCNAAGRVAVEGAFCQSILGRDMRTEYIIVLYSSYELYFTVFWVVRNTF